MSETIRDRPKTSNCHVPGIVRDTATKFLPIALCSHSTSHAAFDVNKQALRSVLEKSFTRFREFLNANDAEKTEANPLKLPLLPKSSRAAANLLSLSFLGALGK